MTEANKQVFLDQVDEMHLRWFGDPSGDSGGESGGETTSGKPGTGDAGAAKPGAPEGQDGSSAEGQGDGSSSTESDKLPPYSEQISKDLRKDPEVQKVIREHKDVNDLFRKYLDLRKGNGDAQGTTASQTKPEEYELSVPEMPGGEEYDTQHLDWFRQTAAEAGLTQEQAQKVFDQYNKVMIESIEAEKKASKEQFDQAMEHVKNEFGEDFKTLAASASKLAKDLGGDEFIEFLENAQLDGVKAGNHPTVVSGMIRLAQEVKKKVGDDVFEVDRAAAGGKKPKRKGVLRFANTPGMDQ